MDANSCRALYFLLTYIKNTCTINQKQQTHGPNHTQEVSKPDKNVNILPPSLCNDTC